MKGSVLALGTDLKFGTYFATCPFRVLNPFAVSSFVLVKGCLGGI